MYKEEDIGDFLHRKKRRGSVQSYYKQEEAEEQFGSDNDDDEFDESGRVILQRVGHYVLNMEVYLYVSQNFIESENIVYHTDLQLDLDSMPILWSLLQSRFAAQEFGNGLTSTWIWKHPWKLKQTVSLFYDHHGEMYMDQEPVMIGGTSFSLYKIGLCATARSVQTYKTKNGRIEQLQNLDCGNLQFVFQTGHKRVGRPDGGPPKYSKTFTINVHLYHLGSRLPQSSIKALVANLKIPDVDLWPHRFMFSYDRSQYWDPNLFSVKSGKEIFVVYEG